MRNSLRYIILSVALAVVALSCDDLQVSALEAKPGEELQVRLKEGSNVFLTPDNITFTFTKMVGDSRCPKGAMCFWGGLAEILVNVKTQSEQTIPVLLWIPGLVSTPYRRNVMKASGYNITLLQLDPYPEVNHDGSPVVYEALFAIEKIKTR